MGILARLLRWLWRRWADYNSLVALLDLLDWKTTLIAIGGGVVTVFAFATRTDWSWQIVLLYALVATACIAIISVAIRSFWLAISKRGVEGTTAALPSTETSPGFAGFSFINGRFIQPSSGPVSDPFPRAFNVPGIWFQNNELRTKSVIHINIDIFNGNNEEILVKGIEGEVSLRFKASPLATPVERGRLITPTFPSVSQLQFGALKQFYLILEQPVSQRLAEEFLNWADNTIYVFDFENLNIVLHGVDSKKEARVPLWDQAELPKNFWGRMAMRGAIIRPDRPLNMPSGQ
jgi:hypothetical protein